MADYKALGESFPLQFVWSLPSGEFLRAVFEAVVLEHDLAADKYVVRLSRLVAGRQETAVGKPLTADQFDEVAWAKVRRLAGRRVQVAFESDNGRPLRMRYATLTGEHNFFFRYDDEV